MTLRRPGHLAPTAPPAAPFPWSAPGREPETAVANVVAAGGSEPAFRGFLSAALDRVPSARRDAPVFTALAGVAGWRSGVIGLRDDALGHLSRMRDHQGLRAAASAVLGVDDGDLDEFVARQHGGDRFWWSGRAAANGYVCAVGGFAGFGDAWTSAPDSWMPLSDPGSFAVRAGDWWRVDVDVWGHRLERLAAEPTPVPAEWAAGVQFVLRPDTYLAWVHVADEPR